MTDSKTAPRKTATPSPQLAPACMRSRSVGGAPVQIAWSLPKRSHANAPSIHHAAKANANALMKTRYPAPRAATCRLRLLAEVCGSYIRCAMKPPALRTKNSSRSVSTPAPNHSIPKRSGSIHSASRSAALRSSGSALRAWVIKASVLLRHLCLDYLRTAVLPRTPPSAHVGGRHRLEMLAESDSLTLVRRLHSTAVEPRRRCHQKLIGQPADHLTMFDHERDFKGSNFENGSRPPPPGIGGAESRIEETPAIPPPNPPPPLP